MNLIIIHYAYMTHQHEKCPLGINCGGNDSVSCKFWLPVRSKDQTNFFDYFLK